MFRGSSGAQGLQRARNIDSTVRTVYVLDAVRFMVLA